MLPRLGISIPISCAEHLALLAAPHAMATSFPEEEVEDKDVDDYPARFAGSVNKPRRN